MDEEGVFVDDGGGGGGLRGWGWGLDWGWVRGELFGWLVGWLLGEWDVPTFFLSVLVGLRRRCRAKSWFMVLV